MNKYSSYTDLTLLVLLKENKTISEQAFEVIWNRYSKKLLQYCFLNTDNQYEAEELFQDTWVSFYEFTRKKKSNLQNIGSINFYLFKIAFNFIRKKNNNNEQLISLDSFNLDKFIDHHNFFDEIEYRDELSRFYAALNYLDDKSKESVLLKWIAGLSFSEIAQISDESYDTIRMRCSRAMGKILTMLDNDLITIGKVKK